MKKWLMFILLCAAPLHAQDRAGATGAQVLQFLPGSRAAAFSGAYTAFAGDADALFYNPAGIANVRRAGTLAYEKYVSEIAYGSIGVAARVSSFTIGASVAFLDAGDVNEVIPDEEFGGNTGTETGNVVSASESAVRIVAAMPMRDGGLRAGAAIGFVSSSIADQRQSAPLADLGVQYDIGSFTIGTALKNIGANLSGDASEKLPSELRVGASTQLMRGAGVITGAIEVVSRFGEGSLVFVGGLEAGLPATDARPFTLLGRIGMDSERAQLGALRAGASVGFREISFDYTYQNLDYFGAVHRFGIRATHLR